MTRSGGSRGRNRKLEIRPVFLPAAVLTTDQLQFFSFSNRLRAVLLCRYPPKKIGLLDQACFERFRQIVEFPGEGEGGTAVERPWPEMDLVIEDVER